MTSTKEPREFLTGKLAQVDVGRIESELRGLWKQATNTDEGIAGDVVRAVSFTLVVYSTDEANEQEIATVLDDIMSVQPCRAILAFYREQKPHALDAWVTARCHLMGGKKHVCSEQITVYADGAQPEELASVVSPLVLADLPVVLWWRSQGLKNPVLQALHEYTNQVIMDSGHHPYATSTLVEAADLVIEQADCLWLADLNWRRLRSWRRSLAEAFDGFPMPSEYLRNIKEVRITSAEKGKSGGMSNQALLLSGWLATRLDWHHDRDKTSKDSLGFRTGGHSVVVQYSPNKDAGEAAFGNVQSVSIDFIDGRQLNIVLEQNGSQPLITAQELNTESKESTRVDQHFTEGVLVGQELELMSRDRIFEQSLLIAGEISRLMEQVSK